MCRFWEQNKRRQVYKASIYLIPLQRYKEIERSTAVWNMERYGTFLWQWQTSKQEKNLENNHVEETPRRKKKSNIKRDIQMAGKITSHQARVRPECSDRRKWVYQTVSPRTCVRNMLQEVQPLWKTALERFCWADYCQDVYEWCDLCIPKRINNLSYQVQQISKFVRV